MLSYFLNRMDVVTMVMGLILGCHFASATEVPIKVAGSGGGSLAIIGVGLLGTSVLLAHALAPASYSLQRNTLSELGGQNYQNAWAMRSGLIGFGIITTTVAVNQMMQSGQYYLSSIPLGIYGISMALTGVFSAASFETGKAFSPAEARLHSLFANLAGVALTSAMIGAAISEPDTALRVIHWSASLFTLVTSAMFKFNPEYRGIWQRVLWTGSLGWVGWNFSF